MSDTLIRELEMAKARIQRLEFLVCAIYNRETEAKQTYVEIDSELYQKNCNTSFMSLEDRILQNEGVEHE